MSKSRKPKPVRNPYPEWQALAATMNCWNCYRVLWRKAETDKHLCGDCQNAGLTAKE